MATASEATSVRSVCPYCGVGCGVLLDVRDGRIAAVAGDRAHPANAGRLCTKGKTAHEAVAAPGRLATALRRPQRGAAPETVPMAEAIAETGRRLRAIADRDGPEAVAIYVSGQMSIEAQYLANKLAKGYLRTPHIESNSRLCMASAGAGYKLSLGADAPPGAYDDFDHTDLFLVVGANMADCHPILFLRMMDRVKAGARLIVVDPRRTATAEKADLHLAVRPGSDLALLNGLLRLVVDGGGLDAAFVARFTEGWEEMPALLADYPPERVAALTGLAEADIRRAAAMILAAPEFLTLWTMGLNQSVQGTFNTNAVCNLHLATGRICRPGSGPFSLTGQPNAMGGREMGYMGPGLPGQRSALAAADRAFCEARWGLAPGTIRSDAGSGTVGLFEAMGRGEIKAAWIICTNPVASVAGRDIVRDGLARAEFVVAQDAFAETETNACADVVLAAALSFEADGVTVNSERSMALTAKAVEPPGEAMADWAIVAAVARAMGHADGFDFASAAEVFEEIRGFSNPQTGYDIAGVSHARLAGGPVQWPAPATGGRRNPIRYLDTDGGLRFATESGRARFWPRPHAGPAERPDGERPLVLVTGRLQHQWHTLTKTGRVPALNRLNPAPFVEIHPRDAARFAVADGAVVEIASRHGRARLPAAVTDRIAEGTLFAPFHWNDLFGEDLAVNAVTGRATDPISLQPEFKVTAVAVTPQLPVPGKAEDPAPAATEAAVVNDEASPDGRPPVVVFHASQTGTAEAAAGDFAHRLAAAGRGARLVGLDKAAPGTLGAGEAVFFVSTFGDGEPPDSGAAFWLALAGGDAPPLAGLAFAVIAFGDSSYGDFCGFGRKLDARLTELGAARLADRADCDAGADDAPASAAARLLRLLAPDGGGEESEPQPPSFRRALTPARLVLNRRLGGDGGGKEVRQFALALEEGTTYEAGDALGVMPRNCPELVGELIAALGLSPDAAVGGDGDLPFAEALTHRFEIARPSPAFLAFWAEVSGDAELAALLAAPDRRRRDDWLWGRQIADIVARAPAKVSAADFCASLKPLQPRLYSISSSPKKHPGEVHLTVSVVRHAHHGRPRKGVASTFLADRADGAGIFVQTQAHFRPPADSDAPAIMIGPGTGVAPFRAFLEEREASGARGANWLFFGEQHAASGFYYRDEIEAWLGSGHLRRLDTAFSRDQAEKIYVQHRMRQRGADIWRWLEDGAHVYVCGDAARMARDVDDALVDIVAGEGGLDVDAARDYVRRLAAARRYCRDVY